MSRDESYCMTEKAIRELLERHGKDLLSLPGVVGVCIESLPGAPNPRLTVLVLRDTKDIRSGISEYFPGLPVAVEECGADYNFR